MGKRAKKGLKMNVELTKRERRMSILLSEDEQLIVDRYLEKYKITNKSRWLRETIKAKPPVLGMIGHDGNHALPNAP